jgi:hypothetical protein
MAIYNPLSWQNENALSNYPFAELQDIQDLLVDAKFVQFDSFIPVLNQITVNNDTVVLSITFDYGTNSNITLLKSTYLRGAAYRSVRIYNDDNSRYVGLLVFGAGVETLWNGYVGRKLKYSSTFLSETVRSIPSKDAVYKLDGNYGNLELSRTATDTTIFYNTSLELNSITFNAVGGHAVPEGKVKEGLRKINLVPPLHNNINLASNDVIKIKSFNATSLSIDLVSGSTAKSFLLPTLIA